MQPKEIIGNYFVESLNHKSRASLNASAQGQILNKTYEEMEALLEMMSEGHHEYHETSRVLPQKAARVLQVDDVAAIRTDISTLTNVMLRAFPQAQQIQPVQHIQQEACNVRPPGSLPSDTEKNPKKCKAVTLRNGRELEEVPQKKKSIAEAELISLRAEPNVHINLPLVELLQEVSKYAKYIKDVVANKWRWTEFKTVALTEECSSTVRSKIPPKLKGPGSFTISITIGNIEVGLALCDLGASINLMPTSVFQILGLGEPRPATIMLQLADRSLAYPDSIIEDVLVKVGPFILPVDIVIIDYEVDKSVPLIMGRGFLATVDVVMRVKDGKISMTVDGQEASFDVFKATKLPAHYEELKMISVVEPELTNAELDHFLASRDPLEIALVYGEDFMIDAEVERVLRVLRDRIRALGWLIADIPSISSSFCMHKILLEEDNKPSVECQR
ncbi:uncharacterized protein LOC132048850 [Lycium ferocissimum]|uniref:uncharacterized protein LOC132048850 n=1 Tax=Lycium ferocissimum TaxID=112874 RepID=UPI0028166B31|nr:uncharacterized protein LOC132048850 [Lycium ferocissimum]